MRDFFDEVILPGCLSLLVFGAATTVLFGVSYLIAWLLFG
jgi:hypothetical protein